MSSNIENKNITTLSHLKIKMAENENLSENIIIQSCKESTTEFLFDATDEPPRNAMRNRS